MIRLSITLQCLGAALALTVITSGCGRNAAPAGRTVTHPHEPVSASLWTQARPDIKFGTIKSITPLGRGYRLRFDLGLILSGATGVQACVDNGQCPKSMRHNNGFPDDIVSADLKFVLPYYLPPNAQIALLNNGNGFLTCTARELYLLYRGQDPRRLLEKTEVGPKLSYAFGWWIKVTRGSYPPDAPLDSLIRVEQQYHP